MKNILKKDEKNRIEVKKLETKRFILKSILANKRFSNLIRWNAFLMLSSFDVTSSKVFLVNRCVETNRKKRINKLYSYSRIKFRKLAQQGWIYGLKRSTW